MWQPLFLINAPPFFVLLDNYDQHPPWAPDRPYRCGYHEVDDYCLRDSGERFCDDTNVGNYPYYMYPASANGSLLDLIMPMILMMVMMIFMIMIMMDIMILCQMF